MAKMKDVAELAGVSNAAVSRYLNGGYISADKAERIKAAIEQTGYVRSNQARALRTGSTRLVGVIVPKINSESVSRITAGISTVLRERGYQMLLANTDNHDRREIEYLELFQNHPVDGIVLVATVISDEHRSAFAAAKVPIVIVGQQDDTVASVFHNDHDAARDLARAVGERIEGPIAYIGVMHEDRSAGLAREAGFKEGLADVGHDWNERLVRTGAFTVDSGYACAKELLEVEPDVAFIACATDTMAAGALRAIDEARGAGTGSRCVSGFGDNAFLRATTGGIPTVHFGYLTSGVEASNLLLDIVEGASDAAAHAQVKLGYQLMIA